MDEAQQPNASAPDTFPVVKTFTLMTPVILGDITYSSITLREPDASEIEDIEARSKNPGTYGIHLIGGVPLKVAEKIKSRDFNAMREYLLFFMNTSAPETGG